MLNYKGDIHFIYLALTTHTDKELGYTLPKVLSKAYDNENINLASTKHLCLAQGVMDSVSLKYAHLQPRRLHT